MENPRSVSSKRVKVKALAADVTRRRDVEKLFADANDFLGKIDIQ
jgi:NAD(P)-dependent dehydrogenase (short-subunit alcohol dehydrogenase family)